MQKFNLIEYFATMANEAEGELELNPNVKRIGKFQVSDDLIKHGAWVEILEQLSFVPVKVEMHWRINGFEYVGFSPLFRELEQSELTPEYDLQVMVNDSGKIEEVTAVESIA